MAGTEVRYYAGRWLSPRPVSRPIGVYWLAAGFLSMALWAGIIAVVVAVA